LLLEGKLPIEHLKKIISLNGINNNESIVIPPGIGVDASALNFEKAVSKCREFYKTQENCYLLVKSDPITFQTKSPGKYSIIVNANDIACLGGIPFGCTVTILVPDKSNFEDIINIQTDLHRTCVELGISVLGGHTEITSAVIRPVVSISMIGSVPHSKLLNNKPQKGDFLALLGYIGNEGTAILAKEINSRTVSNEYSLKDIKMFEDNLYIGKIAQELNKTLKILMMHDPTEGGLLGAIYELFNGLGPLFGVTIYKEKILKHIHHITTKIGKELAINPLRLISSGTLLVVLPSDQFESFELVSNKFQIPSSIIGKIEGEEIMFDDETKINPPKSDELVQAFLNLESYKIKR
jgi:hydrogenase expression/formation protein HypE